MVESAAKVKDWLKSLKGKSEDEIVQLVGKDGTRETWDFRGNKELKLVFESEDGIQLMLFFWNGKVVSVTQVLDG